MAGYRGRSELFGSEPPPTWGEWLTLGVAVIMGLAMLATAIADKSGPAWYRRLGIVPVGITEFMLAWTFLARARINAKGERFTPRQLRGTALIFIVLGVLSVAFGLFTNSKGA